MKEIFNIFFIQPLIFVFIFFILIFQDIGLAIIFFTIFLKLVLLPISFYGYKEEKKLKKIRERIEKETKNIKDLIKKGEILTKIYKEEKFNPIKNIIIQLLPLPFLFGIIFVIQNYLNKVNHAYFLNFIDLTKPNISLALIVLIFQIFYTFKQPRENRNILIFFLGAVSILFFIMPSSILLYFIVSVILTILERKIFDWYQINFTIISINKNNSNRS